MNDFLSKIKTFNYQQFALQHGEKIGMVFVGLIVVTCLALTNWASEYKGEPAGMIDQAEKVASQLKQNQWTEEKKKDFLPYLTAEGELHKVTAEIELAAYDWPIPLSHKLYHSQQPADETDWLPVNGLRVSYAQMPMGWVAPPPPAEPAPDEVKPKPGKADKKKNKSEELSVAPPAMSAGGGGGSADSASAGEKARGVRFNVVVGVVEVLRQQRLLMGKLHVESLSQAGSRLKYVGFRVQRQRAVPGPEHWTGDWKDLKIEASMDVLGEASDFDSELVAAKFTHVEFTSPLPHRLDGEWDASQVVHPRIPTLTEDEQELERIRNEAATQALADQEDDDEGAGARRGGFSRIQKDANQLRQRAGKTEDGSKKMRDYENTKRNEMGIGKGGSGAMTGRPAMGASTNMQTNLSGKGLGGQGGATGGDVGADLLLFRYFDFDVYPGECYRYRVQLIVTNPSFQEAYVSAPAVAEGEFRESPWSAPSPPAVVLSDVEYALTRVSVARGGRHDGAELNVVQFDTSVGTYIMDTFKVVYGALVGTQKKSLHLDVAGPTFREEEVNFSSNDLLLDSAAAPNLSNALSDLNLTDSKAIKKLTKDGGLDVAVTLNRFGEIVELDASSRDDIAAAKKEVEKQREPYDDIKSTDKEQKKKAKESKDSQNSLDQLVTDKTGKATKGGKKKKKKGSNPLKGASAATMSPGSSSPGMGFPPGAGAGSRPAARGGASGRAGGIDR